MKLKYLISVLGLSCVTLAGCATYDENKALLSTGPDFDVSFASTPPGATVSISDKRRKKTLQTCTTPCTLTLNRKNTYFAEFSQAGYNDFLAEIESVYPEPCERSAFTGGILGGIVDVTSGGTRVLSPATIDVTLKTGSQASSAVSFDDEPVRAYRTPEEIEARRDEARKRRKALARARDAQRQTTPNPE